MQFIDQVADGAQTFIGERIHDAARALRVQIGELRPEIGCRERWSATGSLAIEQADQLLDDERFVRKRTARPLPLRIGYLPPLRDQPEECAANAERGLDGVVAQVVEHEVSGSPRGLMLPGRGSVPSRTVENDGSV